MGLSPSFRFCCPLSQYRHNLLRRSRRNCIRAHSLLVYTGHRSSFGQVEASAQVVPTSIAYLRLGDIAAQRGNRDKAAAYYNEVAKTQGELGDEARRKLSNLQRQ